jgi:hypothetical protein
MAYLNPLSVYRENYEQNGTEQPGSGGGAVGGGDALKATDLFHLL